MSFSLQLEAFAKLAGDRADTFVRMASVELLKGVVYRSPVGTGRFRANWSVSLGSVTGVVRQELTDREGLTTVERGIQVLAGYRSGISIHISNGLPYGPRLEFGGYANPPKQPTGKTAGGYSVQAPAGMVRLTLLEVQQRVNAIAASIASGKGA